jgi:hypothetical protein
LTLSRWVQLVGKTGAGDVTAEIGFERSRSTGAGAELGLFVMVIIVVRFALAVLLAPVDAVLALLRIRPWYVEARKLGHAKRRHLWQARGLAPSAALLDDIVLSLRSGRRLPPGGATATNVGSRTPARSRPR